MYIRLSINSSIFSIMYRIAMMLYIIVIYDFNSETCLSNCAQCRLITCPGTHGLRVRSNQAKERKLPELLKIIQL